MKSQPKIQMKTVLSILILVSMFHAEFGYSRGNGTIRRSPAAEKALENAQKGKSHPWKKEKEAKAASSEKEDSDEEIKTGKNGRKKIRRQMERSAENISEVENNSDKLAALKAEEEKLQKEKIALETKSEKLEDQGFFKRKFKRGSKKATNELIADIKERLKEISREKATVVSQIHEQAASQQRPAQVQERPLAAPVTQASSDELRTPAQTETAAHSTETAPSAAGEESPGGLEFLTEEWRRSIADSSTEEQQVAPAEPSPAREFTDEEKDIIANALNTATEMALEAGVIQSTQQLATTLAPTPPVPATPVPATPVPATPVPATPVPQVAVGMACAEGHSGSCPVPSKASSLTKNDLMKIEKNYTGTINESVAISQVNGKTVSAIFENWYNNGKISLPKGDTTPISLVAAHTVSCAVTANGKSDAAMVADGISAPTPTQSSSWGSLVRATASKEESAQAQ